MKGIEKFFWLVVRAEHFWMKGIDPKLKLSQHIQILSMKYKSFGEVAFSETKDAVKTNDSFLSVFEYFHYQSHELKFNKFANAGLKKNVCSKD